MPKQVRILIYEGPQDWLETTMANNAVKGKRIFGKAYDSAELSVTEVTFDQLINQHFQANVPQIYDMSSDTFRPVTDKDIKLLQEKANFAQALTEKYEEIAKIIVTYRADLNKMRGF